MNDPTPVPPGEDSVQTMHQAVQDVMNDPVMLAADGTDGYQDSVARMHDVLMREKAEPHDGFEPVPFWVAIVCGGLLMWGGYYLGTGTADFRRDIFDRTDLDGLRPPGGKRGPEAPDPDPQTKTDLMKVGERVYQRCTTCHKDAGQGEVRKIPPLAGSEWVVGAEASPARLSRVLIYGLKGPVTVKGQEYNETMPHQGNSLRDYEIAGVLTYIRNSWGNAGDADEGRPAITAAVVKAAREKEAGRRDNGTAPVTAAELTTKFPVTYSDVTTAPPKKDGDKDKKDDAKK